MTNPTYEDQLSDSAVFADEEETEQDAFAEFDETTEAAEHDDPEPHEPVDAYQEFVPAPVRGGRRV